MAAHGEIEPMPDCAIFADTGWEPRAVYEHLDQLEPLLPFPVHRVSAGDIRDSIGTGRYEPIPWHIKGGMGRRQCTKQYKLYPIRKRVRELLGGKTPRGGCETWGIDAPRSACCGCPFLSDADWVLRRHQPEWAETVALSVRLAATGQFMHRSLLPLDQVDLRTHAERGQPDLFGNECEGVCGV
jgi:hypothetical protein